MLQMRCPGNAPATFTTCNMLISTTTTNKSVRQRPKTCSQHHPVAGRCTTAGRQRKVMLLLQQLLHALPLLLLQPALGVEGTSRSPLNLALLIHVPAGLYTLFAPVHMNKTGQQVLV